MYQNGIFNAAAAAALVYSVMDWQEGDIIEHDGHFLSFFRADGRRPDKRKVLEALTDYWQDGDRRGEHSIKDRGFFLMRPDSVNERTLKRLKMNSKNTHDPIVGVVAANPQILARQFNSAKRILKRLNVCNDDLPCRLKADPGEHDIVTLKVSQSDSVSSKITTALGIKLPSTVIVEAGVETESSQEMVRTLEQSRHLRLDQGAMKSALLMNRIAATAGVRDLADLETLEAQREIGLTSFIAGRSQDLVVQQTQEALESLQKDRRKLLEDVADLYKHSKVHMKTHWGNSNDLLFSMDLAFDNALHACQQPEITKDNFHAMRDMQIIGSKISAGSWFEQVGEFGAHALLMAACLDEAIQSQSDVLELMQTERACQNESNQLVTDASQPERMGP